MPPRFAEVHGCRLTCAMSGLIVPAAARRLPDIRFVTHEELVEQKLAERVYATYCLGLFFDDEETCSSRPIFAMSGCTAPPATSSASTRRGRRRVWRCPMTAGRSPNPMSASPCKARTQCKNWNNPNGWREVVAFLKEHGYRVICIDQKPVHGTGIVWTHIPHGAEDETGDRPLAERARWLRHADFFIGLSSGLSWLAWAAGRAGGADQRLHPSDQRIRHALPRHQLARLQQLLERRAASGSITRISCGARATPARRGSSSARG